MEKNTLPRITKILAVEPYKIMTLWNNSEVREIDFIAMFQVWKTQNDENLLKLQDFNKFNQVSVSPTRTLEWKNIVIDFSFKGQNNTQPLELDPDVLYQNSVLIRKVEHLKIGLLLKKTRKELGLTQVQVATNVGTTRHYISRIENEQSEIQLDTLQKIIELGLGKKMELNII